VNHCLPSLSVPIALLALVIPSLRQTEAGDKNLKDATIEELIADLGNSSFTVREQASQSLWRHGRTAVPSLQKAAQDASPEISRRASELLATFDWYIFPDTPPGVLKQIKAFRMGRPDQRTAAFAELFKLGKHGRGAIRSLLSKDLSPAVRQPLVTHLTTVLRHDVPLLLFENRIDEAAELLELHTAGTTPEGAADFAAWQVLRDRLPTAIATAEAARNTVRSPQSADLILAHLYRANRDWPKARRAVSALPDPPNGIGLVDMLREEEGDWTGLLHSPPRELNLPAAYRLTFLRLSGKRKEFLDEARRLRETAADYTLREDVQDAACSLLVNNRASDAAELLLEKRLSLGLLSEILIARLDFKDSLELLGEQKPGGSSRAVLELDLRRARVLAMSGQRGEAIRLFNSVAARVRIPKSEDWDNSSSQLQRALLRSELRVGYRDLACDHAASFVKPEENSSDADASETVFELMFGADAAAAETLFRGLRAARVPSDDGGATMRLVRGFLNGTVARASADAAIAALTVDRHGDLQPSSDRKRLARLSALAIAYRGAGRVTEAERAFTEAAEAAIEGSEQVGARSWVFGLSDASRPWVELGDFLVERGRFADAAFKYEAGWLRFPDQPLLLFLSGRAFARTGNSAEAERRMELAHWVALGNERVRGKFLEELIRRGEVKAGTRETDLLLRACWSRDFYFGNVMNQAARAAALSRDWSTAERCVQRSLLVLIKAPGAHYLDAAAYLNVPNEMLIFRARGLLAAGKVEEAMEQARACLEATPGNLELVNGMAPELDRLGRKKEAEELFLRVWEAYRRVLAEAPASPWARNALASLAAGCRRELGPALLYAREAVAAEPLSPTYRETLAEVQFRLGDRVSAEAVMARLLEEFPRNRLYRRQLERYKNGDVTGQFTESAAE
jgi:tetratricopeptide (TPR) repeat protein